ncbi:MAG: ABC transporter substrate-binding protein [Candidatus Lokiarchaeota archaeon]|nr:ABC transporter substrate-binding protein [Candidatus Lokiarchaeota archaeon]
MKREIKVLIVFLLLGCNLVISSILTRRIQKYQEYYDKSFLKSSAPSAQSLIFGTEQGNIVDLDPHNAYDWSSNDVINQVVEHLYQFNLSDPTLPLIPWLASSFPSISSNGTEYIITLRQGIVFHDNATLNATAVKWSFDRLCYFINYSGNSDLPVPFNVPLPAHIQPTKLQSLYIQSDGKRIINKTDVLSLYSIRITLNAPKASFLSLLAQFGSGILSPKSTPPLDYYQLNDTLIGSGPFKYIGFIPDVEVKFASNPDYWGTPDNTGTTQLESLIYLIVPDDKILIDLLAWGPVAIIDKIDPSFIPQFQADPNIEISYIGNTLASTWVIFNYLLINLTMRKAISWCLNYSSILDVAYKGLAVRLPTYIPFGISYANYSLNAPQFDRELARHFLLDDPYYGPILAGVGITDDSPDSAWLNLANGPAPLEHYNFTTLITSNPKIPLIANRLASDTEYIGVKIEVLYVTFLDWLDSITLNRHRLNMYMLGWLPEYYDPENFINPLWSNLSDINGGNFYEPDVQALMEAGLTETDPTIRKHIYNEIQRLMVEEYLPAILLFSDNYYSAWRTNVHGWIPNPLQIKWFYPVYIEFNDLTPPELIFGYDIFLILGLISLTTIVLIKEIRRFIESD